MSFSLFPTPPLCLLREDGSVVDAESKAAKANGDVALSRGLCRFEYFRAPPGLSAADRDKAVRLKAESSAPFRKTGTLLLRAPGGAVIWSWDAAQVAILLNRPIDAELRVAPETLYRGVAVGWRILEVSNGYEAQYWQEGALLASTWRRAPFEDAQWSAFVLGVDQAEIKAPEKPPALQHVVLSPGGAWRRQRIGAPWTLRQTENLARAAGLCVAAVAMFCFGYALHLEQLADRDEHAAARVHSQLLSNHDARLARSRLELLTAYQEHQPSLNVLDAGGQALEALRKFGIDATDWSVDERQVRVTMPYVRDQTPLRDILAEFQARSFRNAQVTFEAGGEQVTITAALGSRTAAPAQQSNAP